MPETLSYVYSSEGEINRRMSVPMAEDYSEDDPYAAVTDPDDNLDDAIALATDEVNVYCLYWYTEADLADSLWVRNWATWMACYHLTQRKGEPAKFENEYNKAIGYFERIRNGELQIPRLPQRADLAPCHSNYVIDSRFTKAQSRVQRETSTGQSYGAIPADITFDPGLL